MIGALVQPNLCVLWSSTFEDMYNNMLKSFLLLSLTLLSQERLFVEGDLAQPSTNGSGSGKGTEDTVNAVSSSKQVSPNLPGETLTTQAEKSLPSLTVTTSRPTTSDSSSASSFSSNALTISSTTSTTPVTTDITTAVYLDKTKLLATHPPTDHVTTPTVDKMVPKNTTQSQNVLM